MAPRSQRSREGDRKVKEVRLTHKMIASLKVEKRTDFWDQDIPSFGLRVSPHGRKTFQVMYYLQNKKHRLSLGVFPTVGLAEARREARAKLGLVAAGEDPRGSLDGKAGEMTFRELAEQFVEEYARPHRRGWREDLRIIKRDLLPSWGRRRAEDIVRREVKELLCEIGDGGAPAQALKTARLVKRIFNWGVEEELVEKNPAARLRLPYKDVRRVRVLSDGEIGSLWHALEDVDPVLRGAVRLMLLTGQRSGEVSKMEWGNIEDGVWVIPGAVAKNGQAHAVPLSEAAWGEIEAMKGLSESHVFPAKRDRDRPFALSEARRLVAHLRRELGGEHWRLHDLRRTAATHMARLGVAHETIGRVLNHSRGGVTDIYNRWSYLPELREALEKWGARVEEIVSLEAGKPRSSRAA